MPKKIEINPKTSIRIKEFLKESGLKQQDLAELIFCTPQHISRLVQGHVGLSRDFAEAIARHYSIRVEYLLGEDDYKTEGSIWKETLEEERKKYDKCLKTLISIAEISGFSIVFENVWKIKKRGVVQCSCSTDKLEVLAGSFMLHTEQLIKDFINFETLK